MVIVTTINDNVINGMLSFETNEEAESAFADLVIHFDGESPADDELNGALDDGYWECENGFTICISHPQNGNTDENLADIRKQINTI